MRIDPLETRHPGTGAVRLLTPALLAEVYLAPRAAPLALAEAIGHDAPWSASHEAAPAETEAALLAALRAAALGSAAMAPDALQPDGLPEGRARDHLTALKALWERLGGALPEDLAPLRHLLSASAEDALEPLPILQPAPCRFALPAEAAVQARLIQHHGTAPEADLASALAGRPAAGATAPGALGHLQGQLAALAAPVAPDATMATWGLRDPVEEAAFAAALVQRMLDDGRVAAPSEVGVLAPNGLYGDLLAGAFEALGLPLAGVAPPAPRDGAAELLTQLLRLVEAPGGRMALAAVVTSPLMPWPQARGSALARQLMRHGRLPRDEDTSPILSQVQPPVTHTAQLFARLSAIAEALAPDHPETAAFTALIHRLRAALTGEAPDWRAARRIAEPQPNPTTRPERFVEGVSLFDAAALPWRRCRRLIVLGLAGDAYPAPVAADPMFLDREKLAIRAATGLWLPTRGETLARRIELFRRQLCAASEGADLLVPALDARGRRQAPATGLALIARGMGVKDPAELVTDLRAVAPEAWPVTPRSAAMVPEGGRPALPETGEITLGTDLFALRRDPEGRARPQSPSRLDTLLVSPLAWVLSEMEIESVAWAPETLDVLALGSLAHHVLEHAFPAGEPLPEAEPLSARMTDLVAAAIRAEAPWLAAPGWEAERASLLRETSRAAEAWRRLLAGLGAEVIANEVSLAGEGHGLVLSGRADCILRLGDGRLVIVDHKRSSSSGREKRMKLGWDLQVELYRAMLARPSRPTPVPVGDAVAVAYHCLLDGRVLADGLPGMPGIDDLGPDISTAALDELRRLSASLGAGLVPLGRAGDAKRFDKDRGMKAYALDDAFVGTFLLPEIEPETEAEP